MLEQQDDTCFQQQRANGLQQLIHVRDQACTFDHRNQFGEQVATERSNVLAFLGEANLPEAHP